LTGLADDPLTTILRSKREATRFQCLVEIAEHQPAVRQLEVAETLGITPQAVSEYIRELAEDGLVASQGRGRYEVTREGIEWVLSRAEQLETYSRHIRRDLIQQVSVWAAVAVEDLEEGDMVGVYMQGGLLYAGKEPRSANGAVVRGVVAGEDVGVTRLSGLIEHREGIVSVAKVPRVEKGGSRAVDLDSLAALAATAPVVAAVGIEARVALEKAGRAPDMFFGAREGAIEAAFHGLDCLLCCVDEEFTEFLKRLEDAGLTYRIHDLMNR
jgi:putative transcriptional regulator